MRVQMSRIFVESWLTEEVAELGNTYMTEKYKLLLPVHCESSKQWRA
jgi:hypothetical protein